MSVANEDKKLSFEHPADLDPVFVLGVFAAQDELEKPLSSLPVKELIALKKSYGEAATSKNPGSNRTKIAYSSISLDQNNPMLLEETNPQLLHLLPVRKEEQQSNHVNKKNNNNEHEKNDKDNEHFESLSGSSPPPDRPPSPPLPSSTDNSPVIMKKFVTVDDGHPHVHFTAISVGVTKDTTNNDYSKTNNEDKHITDNDDHHVHFGSLPGHHCEAHTMRPSSPPPDRPPSPPLLSSTDNSPANTKKSVTIDDGHPHVHFKDLLVDDVTIDTTSNDDSKTNNEDNNVTDNNDHHVHFGFLPGHHGEVHSMRPTSPPPERPPSPPLPSSRDNSPVNVKKSVSIDDGHTHVHFKALPVEDVIADTRNGNDNKIVESRNVDNDNDDHHVHFGSLPGHHGGTTTMRPASPPPNHHVHFGSLPGHHGGEHKLRPSSPPPDRPPSPLLPSPANSPIHMKSCLTVNDGYPHVHFGSLPGHDDEANRNQSSSLTRRLSPHLSAETNPLEVVTSPVEKQLIQLKSVNPSQVKSQPTNKANQITNNCEVFVEETSHVILKLLREEATTSVPSEEKEEQPTRCKTQWETLMGQDLQMKILSSICECDEKTACQPQDAVLIDFIGRLAPTREAHDGDIFQKVEDWWVVIGEKHVLPALEMGVRFLHEGQTGLIWSHSKFAYGPSTRENSNFVDVPPNANVSFEVTVKNIAPVEQVADPKFQVTLARSHKQIGNDIFINEKSLFASQRALVLYQKTANSMIQVYNDSSESDDIKMQDESKNIFLDCLNNIVAVHLRNKEYHKAKEAAIQVLLHDNTNLKALIRAAKAAMLDPSGSYEEADAAIKSAEKVDANNVDVKRLRAELKQRKKEYKMKTKEMMARMKKGMAASNPVEKESCDTDVEKLSEKLSSSSVESLKAGYKKKVVDEDKESQDENPDKNEDEQARGLKFPKLEAAKSLELCSQESESMLAVVSRSSPERGLVISALLAAAFAIGIFWIVKFF